MRIFLVGVSCVGKSAVGAKLSELLGYKFFDLDDEIEKYFGTTIERLQNEFLTINFYRENASKALRSLLERHDSKDCVIAMPPSGLFNVYWKVIKNSEKITIVLKDNPENILNRATFYDIDSNQIYKELNEKEKKLHLRDIKKDITYFGKSNHRADMQVDVCGLDIEGAAIKIRDLLESATIKSV